MTRKSRREEIYYQTRLAPLWKTYLEAHKKELGATSRESLTPAQREEIYSESHKDSEKVHDEFAKFLEY